MKIIIHRILGIFIFISIYLISSETLFYIYYKGEPASKIITENDPFYLSENIYSENQCPLFQSLITHPTLGYVHKGFEQMNAHCKDSPHHTNNIGMNSRPDLPVIKNKNEFRIMILGGSVAHHLANFYTKKFINERQITYLEDYLNQNYISPNGFPFVISTGAIGGWTFPNQTIMTLMYAERIDAVIALDGFNELTRVQIGTRLERIWAGLNVLATLGQDRLINDYLYYHRKLLNTLSRSFLKYSYNLASVYKIGTLFLNHYLFNEQINFEFREGATEKINLSEPDKIAWSIGSFKQNIKHLHIMAKINNLYSAQFLQPTKYLGKTLTEEEKQRNSLNFLNVEVLKKVRNMYLDLKDEKLPVVDLTDVFQDEKSSVYSDFVHFEEKDNFSLGNQIVSEAIAKELKVLWKLKSKKL